MTPIFKTLTGWRLKEGTYQSITTMTRAGYGVNNSGLWIGKWMGTHLGLEATWLRFYDKNGH